MTPGAVTLEVSPRLEGAVFHEYRTAIDGRKIEVAATMPQSRPSNGAMALAITIPFSAVVLLVGVGLFLTGLLSSLKASPPSASAGS